MADAPAAAPAEEPKKVHLTALSSVLVRCAEDKKPLTGLFIAWRLEKATEDPTAQLLRGALSYWQKTDVDEESFDLALGKYTLGIVDVNGFLQPVRPDKNPWRDVFLAQAPHAYAMSENQSYRGCLVRHPSAALARRVAAYLNGAADTELEGWGKKDDVLVELKIKREVGEGWNQLVLELSHDQKGKKAKYWPKGHDLYDGWTIFRDMPHAFCEPLAKPIARLMGHLGALRYPIGSNGNVGVVYPYYPKEPDGTAAVQDELLNRTACGLAGFQRHASGTAVFQVADRSLSFDKLLGPAPQYEPKPLARADRGKESWAYLIGGPPAAPADPKKAPPNPALAGKFYWGLADQATGEALRIWLENGYRNPSRVMLSVPGFGDDEQLRFMREEAAMQLETWRLLGRTFGCTYKYVIGLFHSFRDSFDMEDGGGKDLTSLHKTGLAADLANTGHRRPVGSWPIRREIAWLKGGDGGIPKMEKTLTAVRDTRVKAKEQRDKDAEAKDALGDAPAAPTPPAGAAAPVADADKRAAPPPASEPHAKDSDEAAKTSKSRGDAADKARAAAGKKVQAFDKAVKAYETKNTAYGAASTAAAAASTEASAAAAKDKAKKDKAAAAAAKKRDGAFKDTSAAWKAAMNARLDASHGLDDSVAADDAYLAALDDEIERRNEELDRAKEAFKAGKLGYRVWWRLYAHSTLDVFGGEGAQTAALDSLATALDAMPAKLEAAFVELAGKPLEEKTKAWLASAEVRAKWIDFRKVAQDLRVQLDTPEGRKAIVKAYFRESVRPFEYDDHEADGGKTGDPVRADADTYASPAFSAAACGFTGVPKSFINLSALGQRCGMLRIPTAGDSWKAGTREVDVAPTKNDSIGLGALIEAVNEIASNNSSKNRTIYVLGDPPLQRLPTAVDTTFMDDWAAALRALNKTKTKLASTPASPQVTVQLPGTEKLAADLKPFFDKLGAEFAAKKLWVVSSGSELAAEAAAGKMMTGADLKKALDKLVPIFQAKVKAGGASKDKDRADWSITLQPTFDTESAKATSMSNIAFVRGDRVLVAQVGKPRPMEWWHYQSRAAHDVKTWGEQIDALGYYTGQLAPPSVHKLSKTSISTLKEPPETESNDGLDGRRVGYHPDHMGDNNGASADSQIENESVIPEGG